MPPKRKAIGRSTPQARKKKALRASETDEQREARLETIRVRTAQSRSSETDEQREARLETIRIRTAQARSSETDEQREARLETARVRNAQAFSSETLQQRDARLETVRVRIARSRRTPNAYLDLAAFRYDAIYNYSQVLLLEKWINYACIAVPSNLRMKH